MEEPIFVSENAYTHEAFDFDVLKKKGIEYVQKLTGAFWTDYNEHDPGVTILEQLVYAMTDLAYRTSLPIQDLLFDINPDNKIFFNPAEILTIDPITLADYRRVLIDELPDIKNVWLSPILEENSTLKGLFNIIVDPQDYTENDTHLYEKIRRVFAKYRTICEDLEEIIIQKPIEVSILASIEMHETAEPEMVLAELYFRLNEFYNPEIKFLSLEQVIDMGKNVNDLFSGPLLKHGFILDENLQERHTSVSLSDVSRILMQIEGVVSVKHLHLAADGVPFDTTLELTENQSVRFTFPATSHLEKGKKYPIEFLKGNFPYTSVDYSKASRRYNELQASNKRVYRTEAYQFDTAQGQHWYLAEYYSVQNQFPMVYGVSSEGVPLPATDERRAQAKQLKGYLMLFEQVLANYLAQVAHLKDIFSPKTRFKQTYFHQTLDAVPNVQDLYRQDINQDLHGGIFSNKTPIPADYKTGLQALIQQQDNFEERRNKFLDFFLAVHGETFEAYQLSQKPFYKNAQEYAQYQLESKTRFLGTLAHLNKKRTTAIDYLHEDLRKNYRSGLEEKLIILLNLTKEASIFEEITEATQNLPTLTEDKDNELWVKATTLEHAALTYETVEQYFDFVDENDLPTFDFPLLDIWRNSTFAEAKQYSTYFLREGVNLQNYLIGKTPESEKYHLVFLEEDVYRYLGSFDTEDMALQALMQLRKNLQKRNNTDETLYVVENILLRPDLTERKFGFFLLDEQGNRILKSEKRYDFQHRKRIIEQLEIHLFQDENYSVERKDNGNFEIQFKTEIEGEEILMRSIQDNISVQEIHEIAESLFNFIANAKNIIAYEEKIAFYIQITDQDEPIEEDFFHYQISCILPNWTTRLQNPQFQSVAENIIQENVPANTICHVYWLSLSDMQRFQELYQAWLNALQEVKYPKKLEESLRNEFTRFLAGKFAIATA
jgi:hypothetical protein